MDLRGVGTLAAAAPFEWVQVSHSRVYSPARAFRLSVTWITASGSAVEQLIASLQRRAKQSGFVLVQVPHWTQGADLVSANT